MAEIPEHLRNVLTIGEHAPAPLESAPEWAPPSYLEVLRVFGLGEFVDTYRVLPPSELLTYGELMRGIAPDLPSELASVLICAAGAEGSRFGWRHQPPIHEEQPLLWIPRGCFDCEDPDTRPHELAADVSDLVGQWTQPRWAGSGIVQPYFVSRHQWDTAESAVSLPRGAAAGLYASLPDALDPRGGRILYRQLGTAQLTLRCYLSMERARVYVQSRTNTVNPEVLSIRVMTEPGRTPSAKQTLDSIQELLARIGPAQWGDE